MQSMTGYGYKIGEISVVGKASIELRSTNHKFLEIVFHLPQGYLSVEDKIKRELESRFKRGRITCVLTIAGPRSAHVSINKPLIKQYLTLVKDVRESFRVDSVISMDALLHLPGVVIHDEIPPARADLWPKIKPVVVAAVNDLVIARIREGKALVVFLNKRAALLYNELEGVRERFKKACSQRIEQLKTDEERSTFLKVTDITEEIERLSYHIKNFRNTLTKSGTIGKELDFIAQEMQREVNTLAAKTFDTAISGRVVHMKSQIEKIREQVPNVE